MQRSKSKARQPAQKGSKQKAPRVNDTVDAPVARGITARSSRPTLSSSNGNIHIHRREFAGTITNGAVTGYALAGVSALTPGYDLNPGCNLMFPWLSGIAPSYERFTFRNLKLHFIPSQATSTAGRYYVAVDYDYDDSVSQSKVQLMGNMTAAEAPVWQSMDLTLDRALLHQDMPAKYVNLLTRNNFIEPRTAYCGFVMVAFDTPVANCLIDMWVEYDIELISPVSDFAALQNNLTDAAISDATTTIAVGSGFAGNCQWGSDLPPAGNAGPVQVLIPGTPAAPVANIVHAGGTLLINALDRILDLGRAGLGTLILRGIQTVTGAAPNVVIGTQQLRMDANVCDSTGKVLGNLMDAGTGAVQTVGMDGTNVAAIGTNGAAFVAAITVPLALLYAKYASARYIVPYYRSQLVIGAGTNAFGFQYEV